jgi:hypothetical protein
MQRTHLLLAASVAASQQGSLLEMHPCESKGEMAGGL